MYSLKEIRREKLNVMLNYNKAKPSRRHSIGEFNTQTKDTEDNKLESGSIKQRRASFCFGPKKHRNQDDLISLHSELKVPVIVTNPSLIATNVVSPSLPKISTFS